MKNIKWIIAGMGAVVLVGVLLIVNNKKSAVINNQSELNIIENGKYKGDYMSFSYPSTYSLEKIATTDGRILENWKLTETIDNPTIITVSLMASDKDLNNFEPVQVRRSDRNQYLEEVGRMGEARGVLFRTIDKKERTVYFSNKRRILTVDYIAKSNDPTKETEYQSFVDGIVWE